MQNINFRVKESAEREIRTPEGQVPHQISSLTPYLAGPSRLMNEKMVVSTKDSGPAVASFCI